MHAVLTEYVDIRTCNLAPNGASALLLLFYTPGVTIINHACIAFLFRILLLIAIAAGLRDFYFAMKGHHHLIRLLYLFLLTLLPVFVRTCVRVYGYKFEEAL